MSLKKIMLIIPFAIFTAVLIFIACSSDEEPPVVFPPTDQVQVYYVSADDASNIVIDGELNEGIWQAAAQSQITTYDTSDYNPRNKIFLVKMQALCDSTYVYISATWQDDTRLDSNYLRWKWIWRKTGSSFTSYWTRDLIKEDNLAIFFEQDPQVSLSLNEIGPNCLNMCHTDTNDRPLYMLNETGSPVDGWYWRAALMKPLNKAIDLNFVNQLDTDSFYYGLDEEVNTGYLFNRDTTSISKPLLYWTDNPDTMDFIVFDTIYDDENEIDTIIIDTVYIWDHGEILFAADTLKFEFNPQEDPKIVDTVFVPSYVICDDPSGSRWDVEAKGTYYQGRWTVEFKRKMNTGNSDDVVFNIDDEIGMVIAVGDNFKDPHYGFEPILLKF